MEERQTVGYIHTLLDNLDHSEASHGPRASGRAVTREIILAAKLIQLLSEIDESLLTTVVDGECP